MHRKAELVQARLRELGATGEVQEMPASTRTSAEAAEVVGTTVDRIAKSIVVTLSPAAGIPASDSGPADPSIADPSASEGLLVIASGANRVDLDKVAAVVGRPVATVDAKTVKRITGFAAGGVPPIAHANPLRILVDRDLLAHPLVWAAAGTPNTLFPITPEELVRITGGEVADIRVDSTPAIPPSPAPSSAVR